jgi:hypothetical protein
LQSDDANAPQLRTHATCSPQLHLAMQLTKASQLPPLKSSDAQLMPKPAAICELQRDDTHEPHARFWWDVGSSSGHTKEVMFRVLLDALATGGTATGTTSGTPGGVEAIVRAHAAGAPALKRMAFPVATSRLRPVRPSRGSPRMALDEEVCNNERAFGHEYALGSSAEGWSVIPDLDSVGWLSASSFS